MSTLRDALVGAGPGGRYLAGLPAEWERMAALAVRLGEFGFLAEKLGETLDRRGRIRDDATPRLARLRTRIVELRGELEACFARLLRQQTILKLLQYPGATLHGDRMVLPLRSDLRGRIPGVIHRSSDSGQTLFVEPTEAVELNNALIRLTQEESLEVGRILWELTQLVHRHAAALIDTFDALAIVDLLTAKHQLAMRHGLTIPELNRAGRVRLPRARHPLLLELAAAAGGDGRTVVPIDVRLGEDFDALIITGPNTGGKTVALKTVGLAALMAQAGLPIAAAAGATVPVFSDVLVDIGDEQSLQQSLSTFSAHLTRILEIFRKADGGALVLLDELGAGTDPDDGAALGRAIVERLVELGSRSMVTTHLGALKALAYEQPRVDNAAVQFDYQALRPTYELRIGEPGNSNALIVAARLGMPTEMVSAAQRHLADRERSLARAIAGTVEARRSAEEARRLAEAAQRAAEQSAAAAEQERRKLAEEKARHERWVARINALRPGDAVHVRRFDRAGVVSAVMLHRQMVRVTVGAMEVEVAVTEVEVGE
ncbi:MAG: DNA strand exchange inhibitor protein [Phycisphaerae bacterium]